MEKYKKGVDETLAERYDEAFLKNAEQRRTKLRKSGKLKVGPRNNPTVERITNLLRLIHQNYYLEFYDAVSILSGVLFEQTLIMVLTEKYRELKGEMAVRRRGELIPIHSIGELRDLGLNDLIGLAGYYRFLTEEERNLAHQLRLIRNRVIHEKNFFMSLDEDKEFYQAEIEGYGGRTEIVRISAEEVRENCHEKRKTEIGAYYVLSRTRQLINVLCAPRVKKDQGQKEDNR